jgi:hypothetical protein
MAPITVNIKHSGKSYALNLDPDLPAKAFKEQVYQVTGIPVDRMKVMVKGGVLKVRASHPMTGPDLDFGCRCRLSSGTVLYSSRILGPNCGSLFFFLHTFFFAYKFCPDLASTPIYSSFSWFDSEHKPDPRLQDDTPWQKVNPKAVRNALASPNAHWLIHIQGQTFMVIGAAGELPKPPEKPIVFLEGIAALQHDTEQSHSHFFLHRYGRHRTSRSSAAVPPSSFLLHMLKHETARKARRPPQVRFSSLAPLHP